MLFTSTLDVRLPTVLSTWGYVRSSLVRSAVARHRTATHHLRSPPDAGWEVTARQQAAFASPQVGAFTADPLSLTHHALGERLDPHETRLVRVVLSPGY